MFKRFGGRVVVMMGLAVGLGLLAACNTVEGVGKDIKATGGALENAADRDK